MALQLSIPSKTFVLGEYLALHGGPAIILTTNPRFELKASENKNLPTCKQQIAVEDSSPAAKLLQHNACLFDKYIIQFIDPYNKRGGFGASSAEFILLSALKKHLCHEKIDAFNLLHEYQQLSSHSKGMLASGADVVAQIYGQLCYFHKVEKKVETFSWPFSNLGYCLIHTGNKLLTHVYLETLKNFNTKQLEKITLQGLASIKNKDSDVFIQSINNYAENLLSQKLVTKHSQKLIHDFAQHSEIVAVKGCGAMVGCYSSYLSASIRKRSYNLD